MNDANENFLFLPVGNAHGDSLIESVTLGDHWAVWCCNSSSFISINNGQTDGTEYWYWTTTNG